MKPIRLLFLAASFFLVAYNGAPDTASAKKWVALFNGMDLTNWQPKIVGHPLGKNWGNTFRVEDGLLKVRYDQYGPFNNTFGTLYFNKKFTNYRLKVVYRFVGDTAAGAPSWGFRDGGIQYHSQAPQSVGLMQPFPVCLEYNFHGGNGSEPRPNGEICASGMYVEIGGKRNTSFCTLPTVQRTIVGDEWVTAEIEVRNGTITHYVNGEQVLTFKNPRLDSAHALGKTFIQNGNDRVKDGYISLQSNSHPLDVRAIELLEY